KADDRIIDVGGKPVKNVEGFMAQVREFKAGQEVQLVLMRGDKKVEAKVVPVQLPIFGLQPDYTDDKEGVLLKGVNDGDAAQKGGLKAGDRIVELNETSVKDLQGYMDALYTVRTGKQVEV